MVKLFFIAALCDRRLHQAGLCWANHFTASRMTMRPRWMSDSEDRESMSRSRSRSQRQDRSPAPSEEGPRPPDHPPPLRNGESVPPVICVFCDECIADLVCIRCNAPICGFHFFAHLQDVHPYATVSRPVTQPQDLVPQCENCGTTELADLVRQRCDEDVCPNRWLCSRPECRAGHIHRRHNYPGGKGTGKGNEASPAVPSPAPEVTGTEFPHASAPESNE